MSDTLVTVAYLGAGLLFIFSLAGLSAQESARRGNLFGMLGMVIAVLVTAFGPRVDSYTVLTGALVIGGAIGAVLASRVEMTAMPQLVAMLHSFVGLAAVLVGIATAMNTAARPIMLCMKATSSGILVISTRLAMIEPAVPPISRPTIT